MLSDYTGAKYGVAMDSWTDPLQAGIGRGTEVITSPDHPSPATGEQ
ncbi:hypothetical protein ACIRRA_35455 [Nocardia sp. NPDC101769]